MQRIISLLGNEKGSLTVEIMVIMALIGVLAGGVFTALNSGLTTAADTVKDKIITTVNSWSGGTP